MNDFVYWTPRVFFLNPYHYLPFYCANIRMTHSPIPPPWFYRFYNIETFGTFEEVIGKEHVSNITWQKIINSKIINSKCSGEKNIKCILIYLCTVVWRFFETGSALSAVTFKIINWNWFFVALRHSNGSNTLYARQVE